MYYKRIMYNVFVFVICICLSSISAYALTLEVWSYTTQAIPQSVIDAYMSLRTGIDIKQRQPSGDFRGEGYLVASVAGTQPALMHMNADFLIMYIANNLINPLTTWIDKGVFGDLSVYIPEVLDSVKYNDEIYCIPHRMSVNTLLYNRQQFDETGLNGDKPPTTWDEFKMYAKKLVKYDNNNKIVRYGAALSVNTSTITSWFLPTLWQADGDLLSTTANKSTKVMLNSDAGRQALNWYVEQVQEGYATQGSPTPFTNGNASMFWQNQSQVFKSYRDAGSDWVDVGPILSYKKRVGYGSLAGWVVSKGPHMEEAVDFLAFTLRKENVKQFLAATALIPVRKDIGREYFQTKDMEWGQKFINELPYVRFDIMHPDISTLQQDIAQVLRRAVLGQWTVNAALEQAEIQANAYLKEKGY